MLIAPVSTVPAQLAHAAGMNTVVTIGFDDSNADQFKMLKMLAAHGMNATFFTNSGFVGTADHLTWGQLHQLYAAGNEIAGHTIDHANIKKLKTAAARHEVCDDRVAIFDHGLNPVSFAYPFAALTYVVIVVYDAAKGETVSGLRWAGVLLIVAGIVLVSRTPHGGPGSS